MNAFARKLQRRAITTQGGGLVPDAPANLVATPGDTQMTVWWTAVDQATGYDVEYRVSPSGGWQAWPRSGLLAQSTITGLTNTVAYDARVRATNAHGASSWGVIVSATPEHIPATGGGLPMQLDAVLVNNSNTNTAYAYIVGLDFNGDNAWTFVSADGQGTYKPPIPGVDHTELAVDCAIPLNAIGAPGVNIKIPRLVSGRIFFSYDQKLHFYMNTNGGLVMPSQLNPADPNIDIQWTFCEFTLNNVELYGNISFVDMLSIPVAFELEVNNGTGTQFVPGLPQGAMTTIGNRLLAQKALDSTDWDLCLFYNSSSQLVRILSPNSATQMNPTAFSGYLEPYVDLVWAKYTNEDLTINTNVWGDAVGRVSGNILDFGGGITFAKPSTAAIWSCSIPPFTTGNDEQGNITARLAAAFNRTTLLLNANQPDGENPEVYYANPTTNHYSRIVHEEVYGALGYAFPYDDVHPAGGISYEGRIQSSNPSLWKITVGEV